MIQCIFYCEFDNKIGPNFSFQYPSEYLSCEQKEQVSEYIITRPGLCNRIIRATFNTYQILGYPICIEDEKYERNNLLFNVGLVLDAATDSFNFEKIVYKLNITLKILEDETGFLSKSSRLSKIEAILSQVFHDFNEKQTSFIHFDNNYSLDLQLNSDFPPPPEVFCHQVPVRIKNIDTMVTEDWDITIQKILPYINGVNHVRKISTLSHISLDLVQSAVRHLLYYNCVEMIDVFQSSNVYSVTPQITYLHSNKEMQRACCKFVTFSEKSPPPPISKVFKLYCSFQPGITMQEFMSTHRPTSLNIDLRNMVIFGVVNKFVSRIFRHSMFTENVPDYVSTIPIEMIPLIDGKHNWDEIISRLKMKYTDISQIINSEKSAKTFFA